MKGNAHEVCKKMHSNINVQGTMSHLILNNGYWREKGWSLLSKSNIRNSEAGIMIKITQKSEEKDAE